MLLIFIYTVFIHASSSAEVAGRSAMAQFLAKYATYRQSYKQFDSKLLEKDEELEKLYGISIYVKNIPVEAIPSDWKYLSRIENIEFCNRTVPYTDSIGNMNNSKQATEVVKAILEKMQDFSSLALVSFLSFDFGSLSDVLGKNKSIKRCSFYDCDASGNLATENIDNVEYISIWDMRSTGIVRQLEKFSGLVELNLNGRFVDIKYEMEPICLNQIKKFGFDVDQRDVSKATKLFEKMFAVNVENLSLHSEIYQAITNLDTKFPVLASLTLNRNFRPIMLISPLHCGNTVRVNLMFGADFPDNSNMPRFRQLQGCENMRINISGLDENNFLKYRYFINKLVLRFLDIKELNINFCNCQGNMSSLVFLMNWDCWGILKNLKKFKTEFLNGFVDYEGNVQLSNIVDNIFQESL